MTNETAPPKTPIALAAAALVDNAPTLTGLTIPPEQHEGVRMHLEITLKLAASIGEGAEESAPVFRP